MLLASAFLVGCFEPKNIVSSIEVVSETSEFDQSFQLTDLNVKVNMTDGTSSLVPLNESMLSADDLAKFSQEGTHTISVSYLNAAASFTITITGEAGADGKEVLLQVADGYIQWQYAGDATWTNLIALSALMGSAGASGKDPAFRVSDGFIQWQYVGDAAWTNLIATSSLVGLTGPAGANGTSGREVTFQVTAEYIQWKYVGDETWTNLLALSALQGPAGTTPTIGISEDGFWVINGVKTTYKASGEAVAPTLLNVTFDVVGGVMPEGTPAVLANVEKGSTIALPIPTKQGYTFEGWWTGVTVNDGQFTNATPVSHDITLYARWKLDITAIQAFLNIPKTNNFAALMEMTAQFAMGEISAGFENSTDFRIYEEDGILYVYHTDIEKMSANGIEDPDQGHYNEEYDLYLNNEIFSMRKYAPDGEWVLAKNFGSFERELSLEFLDASKFEKRDGVNIYDYPLDPATIAMLTQDIDLGEWITVGQTQAFLDLDNQKMTLILNISGVTPTGQTASGTVTMEISITGAGLTTIEIPLSVAKPAAQAMIDQAIEQQVEYDYATLESAAQFDLLVTVIKADLAATTTVFELIDVLETSMNAIFGFGFETDPLLEQKFEVLESMQAYLQSKVQFATEASVIAMTEIFNAKKVYIETAISSEEIGMIFSAYDEAINMAFVKDEAKAALIIAQNDAIDYLRYFYITLEPYILGLDDKSAFWDTFNVYKELILSSTTTEQVNLHMQEAIAAYLVLDLTFNEGIVNFQAEILADLESLFDQGFQSFGASLTVDAYYASGIELIKAATSPVAMIQTYGTVYQGMLVEMLSASKVNAMIELNKYNDHYSLIVVSEDFSTLQGYYDLFTTKINDSKDFWEALPFAYEFDSLCNMLAFDPLMVAIYGQIDCLKFEFSQFSETATPESILAMQAIVATYIPIIEASTTEMEADDNYYSGFQALEAAYVVDPGKAEVVKAKEDADFTIRHYLYFFSQFLSETINGQLWIVSDETLQAIESATSLSEVTGFLDDWFVKVQAIDLTPSNFQLASFKEETMADLTDLYDLIVANVSPLPDTFEADFAAYELFMETSTNLIEIYDRTLVMTKTLEPLHLEVVRLQTIAELLESFEYYYAIVLDSELSNLESTYDNTIININAATDDRTIENLFWEFVGYTNYLAIDNVKITKQQVVSSFITNYEQKALLATEDSIAAMAALIDAFKTALVPLTSETEVWDLLGNFNAQLDAAYMPDPAKLALQEAKDFAFQRLYGYCNNYAYLVALNQDFAYELIEIINTNTDAINSAASVEEVNALYDSVHAMLLAKPFAINPDAIEVYRALVDEWIIYEYYNRINCLLYLPTDLIIAYQSARDALVTMEAPLDMYQQFVAFYITLQSRFMELYKAESIVNANRVYDEWHASVVTSELPVLEAAHAKMTVLVNAAVTKEQIDDAVYNLIQYCNGFSLSIDELREVIFSVNDELNFILTELSAIATDDSAAAMSAQYVTWSIAVISAASIEDVWLAYDEAALDITKAFVQDGAKYALKKAKEMAIQDLDSYISNYFYYLTSDQNYRYPLDNLLRNYAAFINGASALIDVEALRLEGLAKMMAEPFPIDSNNVDYFRSVILENLGFEYEWLHTNYSEVFPMDSFDAYLQAVSDINLTTDPLVMYQTQKDFLKSMNQGILTALKISDLAKYSEIYDSFHAQAADADLPELEAQFALFQSRLNAAVETSGLDFAVDAFHFFCYNLILDPVKQAKVNTVGYLTEEVFNYSEIATDASIIEMNNLLATHTANINACTTVEDVEAEYGIADSAILGAYVEDPAKMAIRTAKNNAETELYNYVDFLEHYVLVTNADTLWDIYNGHHTLIEAAAVQADINLAMSMGFDALHNAEQLDSLLVEDYRAALLLDMQNYWDTLVSPTMEMVNLHNMYYDQIFNAFHPFMLSVMINDYYAGMNGLLGA
jgi:uncharacterized repeat protein (TIGR02543 family)